MIYFAHRGASAKRVQNTLAAFSLARREGAVCYELDVHLLADGQLAVHHDYSLAATAGKEEELAHLKTADLAGYPLHNPFSADFVSVPLLTQVLPIVWPELSCLNIELKNDENRYPGIEQAVLSVVQQQSHGMEKVLFSSFDYSTLQRLRSLAPQARIGWLTRKFELEKAQQIGAESVHINQTRFAPELISLCHANGLKVFVYTVNDQATAQHLAQQGADGIFTDCIDLFL